MLDSGSSMDDRTHIRGQAVYYIALRGKDLHFAQRFQIAADRDDAAADQ